MGVLVLSRDELIWDVCPFFWLPIFYISAVSIQYLCNDEKLSFQKRTIVIHFYFLLRLLYLIWQWALSGLRK